MSDQHIHLGFPEELPDSIAATVNRLALLDASGAPVPAVTFIWRDERDGRRKTLHWVPVAQFQRLTADPAGGGGDAA